MKRDVHSLVQNLTSTKKYEKYIYKKYKFCNTQTPIKMSKTNLKNMFSETVCVCSHRDLLSKVSWLANIRQSCVSMKVHCDINTHNICVNSNKWVTLKSHILCQYRITFHYQSYVISTRLTCVQLKQQYFIVICYNYVKIYTSYPFLIGICYLMGFSRIVCNCQNKYLKNYKSKVLSFIHTL